MDGRLVFNRGLSEADEDVGWLVDDGGGVGQVFKGGGGREVAETVGGLDGGLVGGERALLSGGVLAGLEGGMVEEFRRLVLVTIGGEMPIIARGGGGGLGGRLGGFSGSTFTGMLRSIFRVVCFSFLGGFWSFGARGAWVVCFCCLCSSCFIGPEGLLVVSLSQGAVGAGVVSLLVFLNFGSAVALKGFSNHSAGIVAVVPGLVS